MASKSYEIIYADPPWAYRQKQINFQSYDKGKKYHNDVTEHYQTMTNENIKSLPVADMAASDCLLFMWATGPNLDIALEVGQAWGFEYKQIAFVWDKQRTNYGFYTLTSVELCLVFKKGRIPKKADNTVRQFLSEKLGRHSAKPTEVRKRIDRMYPEAKKIELFARERHQGWDVWGNEAPEEYTLVQEKLV